MGAQCTLDAFIFLETPRWAGFLGNCYTFVCIGSDNRFIPKGQASRGLVAPALFVLGEFRGVVKFHHLAFERLKDI